MDLAEASNGIVVEIKPETALEFESKRGNGDHLEMEDNVGLSCTNNCADSLFHSESQFHQFKVEETEDLELDVLECADNTYGPVCADDPHTTELSSSFGNTFSGSDDGSKLNNSSDAEVESQFPGENGASAVSIFRKKKLSTHWSRFIRPLMWRCRWIELRMKELHSQALKYDQELSAYDEEKMVHVKMVTSDRSAARSVPMTYRSRRKQVMKRRRRKRMEDTVDIPSYMSRHNIFSYYDSRTDGLYLDDDGCGDQVEQNNKSHEVFVSSCEWLMLDFTDGDNSLEQVLLDIEAVQARVHKLKSQLNKEICGNVGEFSSTLDMCAPGDPHSSSALSPRCSPSNNKDAMPVGVLCTPPHYTSEYEIEDMVMPGSAVSSYGDAAHPDIIESTVDLLSSAIDGSLDQHQIGDLGNDNSCDILINNQAAEEELRDFEKVSHSIEKPRDTVKEEEEDSIAPRVSSSETGSETEIVVKPERSVLKRCPKSDIHVRRSKRKRVERRLSPGWNGGKVRKKRSSKEKENP